METKMSVVKQDDESSSVAIEVAPRVDSATDGCERTRTEMAPRDFCVYFVATTILALTVTVVVNLVVNPYFQYETRFFEPVIQPSRTQKVMLFRKLASPPDGLILGSSRVMKLQPDYLQSKTGKSFFNAGMNYAKPEDYLAFLRFYIDETGHAPKILIVGLDVAGFSNQVDVDARLVAEPALGRLVPEVSELTGNYRRWQELLSWSQTIASAKSIMHALGDSETEPLKESYRRDGFLVYHERERQIAEGTYDFASAIAYNEREYSELIRGFDQLSPERCELFRKLVTECQQLNIELFAFMTPLHPQLGDTLSRSPHYSSRRRDLENFLTSLAVQMSFRFVDLVDIASFQGDPSDFVDGIHPLEPNTQNMIDVMLNPEHGIWPSNYVAPVVAGRSPHVIQ